MIVRARVDGTVLKKLATIKTISSARAFTRLIDANLSVALFASSDRGMLNCGHVRELRDNDDRYPGE
jgi:hypothetical protein